MEIRIIESTDIATVLHMAGVLQSDSLLHSEARMATGFPGGGFFLNIPGLKFDHI